MKKPIPEFDKSLVQPPEAELDTPPTQPPEAELDTPPTRPPEIEPESIKVRVLVACHYGQPDDVVSLPADVAKLAEDGGQVDSNKAAVSYALSLKEQA